MVLDHQFPNDARVENEATSLIKEGHSVTLLTIHKDNRKKREFYKGIEVVRIKLSNFIREKMRGLVGFFPVYNMYLSKVIRSELKRKEYQVLHVHDLYLAGAGCMVKKETGIRLVVDLHENYVAALKYYAWSTRVPGKWFISISKWEQLERRWLEQADGIIAVIEENRERLISKGINPKKIVVTPNTLNINEFESYKIEPLREIDSKENFILTYIGGFDSHRGLEHLIDAIKILKDEYPDIELILVGDGRIREELELLVSKLNLAERVKFEGWQPLYRIRSYIQNSDVCLIPHSKNQHTDTTIPHKLFQYMYCKKPVLATNCIPIERIVEQTKSGLIYKSGDSSMLAKNIKLLYHDSDIRAKFGENGHKAVYELYNWDTTVQEMLSFYKKLETNRP